MEKSNPLTLIVFGATGDLYQNKLALALYNLYCQGFLPLQFCIIGFARRPLSDLDFQDFTRDAILKKDPKDKEKIGEFLLHIKYIQGDLENLRSFQELSTKLGENDKRDGFCTNKLLYLATPPVLYGAIFKNIADAGLNIPCVGLPTHTEKNWVRILVEKPFGTNMDEAQRLDKMLGGLFAEAQIFRIDHYLAYLAKGVVEKILSMRFGSNEHATQNESRWNKESIESVRIIFHEKDILDKRGSFFDALGALRDIGQNHMLQMLALVAMDNPKAPESGGLHKARQNVLEKTKLFPGHKIVRGQYEGYLDEPGVQEYSAMETFFRFDLTVDNPKWTGVPFVLEFGKALSDSGVSIEVCFKENKTCMNFPVSNEETLRDAYEKVFYDCLLGDQTIFASTGEILAQWAIVSDILKAWQSVPLIIYKKGSKAEDIK